MKVDRRQFLMGLGATAASLAVPRIGWSGVGDDYRALVCLFFGGGLDNYDTIIPYDDASYSRWATIRRSMLDANPDYRRRDILLPLDTAGFEGRRFALPAEMSGLQSLFASGKAAIIGNVGPLLEPVDRDTFNNNTARLPARLFSHNDQQATWFSGLPEGGSQYGWGGLFGDFARESNDDAEFTAITTGGGPLFVTGQRVSPYQISADGAITRDLFETTGPEEGFPGALPFIDRLEDQPPRVRELINARYRVGRTDTNLILTDVNAAIRDATAANARFKEATLGAGGASVSFPDEGPGPNLRAVANAIAIRTQLGVCRQIFIVNMNGFDTHSGQAEALPRMQAQISESIAAFQAAMEDMGVSDQVTLFTASDFGRTLSVNGDGTDHGWGNHCFVVGGAVRGGTIFGQMPVADFDHALDAGFGRLIPTTSVETFAATMGRWFGLTDDQMRSALPLWDGSVSGFMG